MSGTVGPFGWLGVGTRRTDEVEPAAPAPGGAGGEATAPAEPAPAGAPSARPRSLDFGGLTLQQQLMERLRERTGGGGGGGGGGAAPAPARVSSFVGGDAGRGAADDDWGPGPARGDEGGGGGTATDSTTGTAPADAPTGAGDGDAAPAPGDPPLSADLEQALRDWRTGGGDWGADVTLSNAARDGDDAVAARIGQVLADPAADAHLKARALDLLRGIGTPAAAAAIAAALPALESDPALAARAKDAAHERLDDLIAAARDGIAGGAEGLGALFAAGALRPDEAARAIRGLAAAGTPAAAAALAHALRVTTDPDLHQEALDALGAQGARAVEARLPGAVRADLARQGLSVVEAARAGHPGALAAIEGALARPGLDGVEAQALVQVLVAAGTAAAGAALARATARLEGDALDAAQRGLEGMGSAGLAGIHQAWSGLDARAQAKLVPALAPAAAGGDRLAAHILVTSLRSPDLALARGSARALADAAETTADPALREVALEALGAVATDPEVDGEVSLGAAQHVARLAHGRPTDPASQDALSRLARSPDPGVARVAAEAYGSAEVLAAVNRDPKLQARALADLQQAERTLAVKDDVFRAIGGIRSKEAQSYLLAKVDDPNTSVRAAAVAGLVHDPGVVGELIEKAKNDPSELVREAAREAIPRLAQATTEADRILIYDELRVAAEALPEGHPARQVLLDTAAEVRAALSGGVHDAGRYDQALAAYRSGDRAALAEALTYASPADLKLLEKALARDGKDLGRLLDDLRTGHPEGYGEVIEEWARRASLPLTGATPPESVEMVRRALVQHLGRQGPDALRAFADRTLAEQFAWTIDGAPTHGAVAILAELAKTRDDALTLLVERRASVDPVTLAVLDRGLTGVPAERVDRVAAAIMHDRSRPDAVREAAAIALVRAGSPAGRVAAGRFFEAKLAAPSGELAREVARSDAALKATIAELNDLYKLKALADGGHGKLTPRSRKVLEQDIARLEKTASTLRERREVQAREITRLLGDPDVGAALAALPGADVEKLIAESTAHLSGTTAGLAFAEDALGPAVRDLELNPLWKRVFTGANVAKSVGLDLVTKLAPELALRNERALLVGMQRLLGVSTEAELGKIEDALIALTKAKESGHAAAVDAAEKALSDLGIKDKGVLGKVNAAFTAVNFAIGVKELYSDPSYRNLLSTAKDTAELVELAGKISPRLSRAGQIAGRLAAPLTVAVGALDFKASAERGDTAGMVADGATIVGGAMMLFPATAPFGAVIVIGATVGKWIWGDSDEEKELKKLADKYGLDYEDK